MGTPSKGAVSSIPPCVTIKTTLARKATRNHLIEFTSLEKTHARTQVKRKVVTVEIIIRY